MSEVIEAEKLKQIIYKIKTIEQECLESADILKDSFNEAKSMGFDVKITDLSSLRLDNSI